MTAKSQVVLIGGGRWSRQIILTLLNKIKIKKVICVTNKNNFNLKNWIENKNYEKKIILVNKIPNNYSKKSLAIICNSTKNHYRSAIDAIQKNYNVFIEKPVANSYFEIKKIYFLGKKLKKKIYCSNVFGYSIYLNRIIQNISNKKIKKINFVWHDKIKEFRYGELKRYDKNTTIYFDTLFHIFSLLNIFFKKKIFSVKTIKKLVFEKDQVYFNFKSKKIIITIDLSRKAKKRARLITFSELNNAYLINFSGKKVKLLFFKNKLNMYKKEYINKRTPLHSMLNEILLNIKTNRNVPNNLSILTNLKNFKKIQNIIKN
jgi:hypothetical protein